MLKFIKNIIWGQENNSNNTKDCPQEDPSSTTSLFYTPLELSEHYAINTISNEHLVLLTKIKQRQNEISNLLFCNPENANNPLSNHLMIHSKETLKNKYPKLS